MTSQELDEAIAEAIFAFSEEQAKRAPTRKFNAVLTEAECKELSDVVCRAVSHAGCELCQVVRSDA